MLCRRGCRVIQKDRREEGKKICIRRELNPGLPRGRRKSCHWTTDALLVYSPLLAPFALPLYAPHTSMLLSPPCEQRHSPSSPLFAFPFALRSSESHSRSGLLVANIAQSLGFLVSVGTELPYAPSRPTTAHHAKTPKACPNRVRCVRCVRCDWTGWR